VKKKLFDVFDIDLNRLEEECADQPLLFIHYSQLLKKAKKNLAQEKSKLELCIAEIEMKIRMNPTKFGLPAGKPTEKSITTKALLNKKCKQANKKYLKVKDKADTLQVYVGALEYRKRALSDLVQLHGQQYFSKPYTTSEYRKVVAELESDALQEAANKKLHKRKKKQ